MPRGGGGVSGECFTSLNFVCLRSQYVGAVNSKLSAGLSGFVARFCNRGFNDRPTSLPPSLPQRNPSRAASPSGVCGSKRGKALSDINFVNNGLPASPRRETLHFSVHQRRFPPSPLPPSLSRFPGSSIVTGSVAALIFPRTRQR